MHCLLHHHEAHPLILRALGYQEGDQAIAKVARVPVDWKPITASRLAW